MSNPNPPTSSNRRLPLGPPSTLNSQAPGLPEMVSIPDREDSALPKPIKRGLPQLPDVKPHVAPGQVNSHSFTDVFDDEGFFEDVPRTLTVNDQPFFRWFKRVSVALIVTSLFLLAVTFFVKAPLEMGLIAIAAVWIVVLAFSLPEAIIPYKKTKFDLSDNTVKVGQKKPVPLSDIKVGAMTVKNKNVKLWLGFSEKNGFTVPLRSSKFAMKKADLLALRTIIPHTHITPFGNDVEWDSNVKNKEVTQNQIVEYVETLIGSLKS